MQLFGENGPLLVNGVPQPAAKDVLYYITTLCSQAGSDCFSATGSVVLLFDGVYDDVSTSPYADAEYIVGQLTA